MFGSTRIFLGDLARALAMAGGPGAEDWEQIADLLGFRRQAQRTTTTTEPPPPAGADQPPPEVKQLKTASTSTEAPATAGIGDLIEFELDRTTPPPRQWPEAVAPMFAWRPAAPLFLKPLLDPLWERGILIEAVGRPLPEGDIDIAAAIEVIARGSPLGEVPREKVQSLSKGCHLLVDHGTGMRPFGSDADAMIRSVRRAVGSVHTHLFTFVDCPTRGVLNENYEEQPYMPPENGALVLAVSDLCSGGPASAVRRAAPRDWLRTARMIRDAGSMLVVLNPYPRERWPVIVSTQVPILYWDRATRTADVRRTRRRVR